HSYPRPVSNQHEPHLDAGTNASYLAVLVENHQLRARLDMYERQGAHVPPTTGGRARVLAAPSSEDRKPSLGNAPSLPRLPNGVTLAESNDAAKDLWREMHSHPLARGHGYDPATWAKIIARQSYSDVEHIFRDLHTYFVGYDGTPMVSWPAPCAAWRLVVEEAGTIVESLYVTDIVRGKQPHLDLMALAFEYKILGAANSCPGETQSRPRGSDVGPTTYVLAGGLAVAMAQKFTKSHYNRKNAQEESRQKTHQADFAGQRVKRRTTHPAPRKPNLAHESLRDGSHLPPPPPKLSPTSAFANLPKNMPDRRRQGLPPSPCRRGHQGYDSAEEVDQPPIPSPDPDANIYAPMSPPPAGFVFTETGLTRTSVEPTTADSTSGPLPHESLKPPPARPTSTSMLAPAPAPMVPAFPSPAQASPATVPTQVIKQEPPAVKADSFEFDEDAQDSVAEVHSAIALSYSPDKKKRKTKAKKGGKRKNGPSASAKGSKSKKARAEQEEDQDKEMDEHDEDEDGSDVRVKKAGTVKSANAAQGTGKAAKKAPAKAPKRHSPPPPDVDLSEEEEEEKNSEEDSETSGASATDIEDLVITKSKSGVRTASKSATGTKGDVQTGKDNNKTKVQSGGKQANTKPSIPSGRGMRRQTTEATLRAQAGDAAPPPESRRSSGRHKGDDGEVPRYFDDSYWDGVEKNRPKVREWCGRLGIKIDEIMLTSEAVGIVLQEDIFIFLTRKCREGQIEQKIQYSAFWDE
ncbi:hypothetical protein P7C70_g7347, partial [Phenoliferia sp. Uapishka_3]